jgi:prepilin-type N-terminal cleavage/methylation domain-containing protein
MSNKKGFTLIEILVVLVIVGVLALVALPNYNAMVIQGSASTAQNNLISIYNAQKASYINNNKYYFSAACPDTLNNINTSPLLSLNLADTNFNYCCTNANGFTCTATNISDGALILTVTGGTTAAPDPIVLPGGTTCAGPTGASPGCNPSCATDVFSYCPSN